MAISAPVILLPTPGVDYTTDVATQTLSGTTSPDTQTVKVNGSTLGVTYTAGETVWAWTGTLTVGVNTLNIVAVERITQFVSPTETINITLIESDNFITISAPTGFKLLRAQNMVTAVCAKNPEPQTVGYNFYVSAQSGGVNGAYVKINKALIDQYAFYQDSFRTLGTTEDRAGNIVVVTTTKEFIRTYYFSQALTETRYNELVAGGLLPNQPFTDDTPLFFVVTAVIYDPGTAKVTESTYSPELQGATLTITTGITDLPARTQNDIILTYSREILTGSTGVDTKPGTALRDIMDPISEEEARLYVIQDFLSRSLSVSTLLDFDDADGDGESDLVTDSVQKRALQVALNLTEATAVQTLIDQQFDKLAANVNVRRKSAVSATGSVIFYIDTAPIRDMIVYEGALVSTLGDLDAGIPAQTYRTTATRILDYLVADSYYNNTTQRYELEVDVEAVNPGESGNTDSLTIRTYESGVDSGFLVENPNPISFGVDQESNHDLATRILLAFFVDTGTEGGYARTAIGVSGVHNVRVEKAGDELMRRDWDPIRKEHIGGKVDIYVQGRRLEQVADQLAFSYESVVASGGTQAEEIFTVINAVAFQFKTNNTAVTAHTPIFEVSRVHNATRGQDYDLTGYQIVGEGTVVDLDEANPTNAAIGLAVADVIRVDYKYRSSDVFVLQRQPVVEIISVTGQLSGPLTSDNWDLVKLQDPLEDGGSTIAKDGIRIKFANNLPVTGTQTIVNEPHVMVLGTNENLDYLGVDPTSIVVKNEDESVTYVANADYLIQNGTETTPTSIRMIESGALSNGQRVLISYEAIENFTIIYTTNGLLATVQEEVDVMKHACADVIVKQSIQNDVDFVITVVPKSGVLSTSNLASRIRTDVANHVAQLGVGVSLTQSDVVAIINGVSDVDYTVIPFLRMVKADGSFIVRDEIGQVQWEIFNEGATKSYITVASVLTYKTVDKGGSENDFRGIFEDDMPLVLQSDPLEVSAGPGRGYIQADGRLIVSTRDGLLPDNKDYQVAYFVYGETGAKDINVASVENLNVGQFSLTFDSPRELSRQSF